MRAPGRWATTCRCINLGSAGFCDRPHRLLFEVEHNDDNETETDLFQHRRPTIDPSPRRPRTALSRLTRLRASRA